MTLTSRAFKNEGTIQEKYSKDGGNISPPLAWTEIPGGTKSLALIVDDPDAPSGLFVHWLLYDIPPAVTELPENMPAGGRLPNGMRQGTNGFGDVGYGGPQPPSGTHRYIFHLYALDTSPDLPPGAGRQELDRAIQSHILEEVRLMGKFQHRKPGTQAA